MRKIDTILFDFDGTVMDTNEVIINSWQHTFRTLEGKERPVEEIIVTFGEPLPITMEKFFPHIPVEKSIKIYREFHYDKFGDLITLFPGMKELLAKLQVQNYSLALVTSRMKGTTDKGMDKFGLKKYFDTVITCEDTDKHKPDPAPINIALDRLDKKPDNAIMLGDTMFDIHCARNAGVSSVLVGWALAVQEHEKSGPHAPDHIIESPDDFLKLLNKLNG